MSKKKRENVQLLSKRTRHNQLVEKKAIGNKSREVKTATKKGVSDPTGKDSIIPEDDTTKATSKKTTSKKNK